MKKLLQPSQFKVKFIYQLLRISTKEEFEAYVDQRLEKVSVCV